MLKLILYINYWISSDKYRRDRIASANKWTYHDVLWNDSNSNISVTNLWPFSLLVLHVSADINFCCYIQPTFVKFFSASTQLGIQIPDLILYRKYWRAHRCYHFPKIFNLKNKNLPDRGGVHETLSVDTQQQGPRRVNKQKYEGFPFDFSWNFMKWCTRASTIANHLDLLYSLSVHRGRFSFAVNISTELH